nr:DUF6596 domain-containing protein [Prauserella shujinwangii]
MHQTFSAHRARLLAGLVHRFNDFEVAEDALADALEAAMRHWPKDGTPDDPVAWLLTVARRRGLDRLRRVEAKQERARQSLADAATTARELNPAGVGDVEWQSGLTALGDERLALVFTCCHPALSLSARVALTLQAVCGLTAADVGRVFLMSEAAMAQRLVRAKRRVRDTGITFAVPSEAALPERLNSVLAVIYTMFTNGYVRGGRDDQLVQPALCAEAVRVAKLLAVLMPDEPEVLGLAALLLLQHSRRATRTSPDGDLVTLEHQDRTQWDRDDIEEGLRLLRAAARRTQPGTYQIQAAIAAEHARAPSAEATDWVVIAELYAGLEELDPSPVVALNRAVALAMATTPQAGLELLARITGLERYHPYHVARAELLHRTGDTVSARDAFVRALNLVTNAVEERHLQSRLAALD